VINKFKFENILKILIPSILIGIFYSILPDIDLPSSKLRRKISKFFLTIILICLITFICLIHDTKLLFIAIILTLFLYILWFSKHRGIFHSIGMGIFLSLPLYLIHPYFFIFAFLGFFTHLLVDGKFF